MSVIFHLSVICLYTFAIWYDQKYVNIPFPTPEFENIPFKARAIYLTFWTFISQTVYFIVALLNDFIGTNGTTKKPPVIRKLKDTLFSLALTTSLYVVLVFWAFYTLNKSAILSEDAEKYIPIWLNHLMHTLILPIILIELLITKRNYPSKKIGLSVTMVTSIIYTATIHIVYFMYGIWPYPFLNYVSWAIKIGYFVCSALLGIGFYLLGEKLDAVVSKNSVKPYTNGIKSH